MFHVLKGVCEWAESSVKNSGYGPEYKAALTALVAALKNVMKFH